MPLYNRMRAIESKGFYKIQYYGGLFKRWKTLKKKQYGNPEIHGFDVISHPVKIIDLQEAEDYVRSRVTMFDLESVSSVLLVSHKNIRLVKYTTTDGIFYHVEENEGIFNTHWLTAKAWRLTHKDNNCHEINKAVLSQAKGYIEEFFKYSRIRAGVNDNSPF